MTYFELTSVEQDYYDRLSEDERRLYIASQANLSVISTVNDYAVNSFVDVSRLLNELHKLHQRYNDINDYIFDKPNATEDQQHYFSSMVEMNEETFSMSMAIGSFSVTVNLSCMDECDALYRYLATVKMSRFDYLCDNFDVVVLINKLQL